MDRIPEPELMDDPAEAEAYAITDFSDVNEKFTERFTELMIQNYGKSVLKRHFVMADLGCGPGDITNRVRFRFMEALIVGVDGAPSMLKYAKNYFPNSRIDWIAADAKRLPFRSSSIDVVFSNSLLHHLADPMPFWDELKRVVKKSGFVFLRDLHRPNSPSEARKIVEMYAGDATDLLKEEYYRSLLSSFTTSEVQEQLRKVGLDNFCVEKVTDRHLDIYGIIT